VVDAALLALVAASPGGWPFPFPPVAAVLGALAVAYVARILAAPTSE
jgi:hypothetical protein